jgi:hypothetical protein
LTTFTQPWTEQETRMEPTQEEKIAWLAWLLLDEVQSLLWNRYERPFMHFMRQEQEQNHLRFLLNQKQTPE